MNPVQKIRSQSAFIALGMLVYGLSQACNCAVPQDRSGTFLHLDHQGSIALPANALGVLFTKNSQLDVFRSDWRGDAIVKTLPAALQPDYFNIMDQTAGRRVRAVVTAVDIDAQIGQARSYFLFKRRAAQIDEAVADFRSEARKAGLADVSASVRSAVGLFRVLPEGGLIAGHRYRITTTGKVTASATIEAGAAIALAAPGAVLLAPEGPARVEALDIADGAPCSAKRAMLVQSLRYQLPVQRSAYARLLMDFTFEQASAQRTVGPAFYRTTYQSNSCPEILPLGSALAGQGKELIVAPCPATGASAGTRQVRGYAGTLELEPSLQPTATIEVAFDKAAAACPQRATAG